MANAKAAFILPTAGSGVNGPSTTQTWNGATYQAPVQASVVELEAAHIGNAATSTSWATLSSLGLSTDAVAKEVRLKNIDASIGIKISTQAAPSGSQFYTMAAGEVVTIPWNRVKDLYVASVSGTPTIQWIAC
jgi:hypothetical protein